MLATVKINVGPIRDLNTKRVTFMQTRIALTVILRAMTDTDTISMLVLPSSAHPK